MPPGDLKGLSSDASVFWVGRSLISWQRSCEFVLVTSDRIAMSAVYCRFRITGIANQVGETVHVRDDDFSPPHTSGMMHMHVCMRQHDEDEPQP